MEAVIPEYDERQRLETLVDGYELCRKARRTAVYLSSVSSEYVLERDSYFYCVQGQFNNYPPITEDRIRQYDHGISQVDAARRLTYQQLQVLAYTQIFRKHIHMS